MQVIITATGELKDVPDGYARNYLLPRQLAKAATATNRAQVEAQQSQLAAEQSAEQVRYAELAKQVAAATVHCPVKASATGRLFAAVHVADVVTALQQMDLTVPELAVTLPPMKQLGSYQGTLRLPGQPPVRFAINIEAV